MSWTMQAGDLSGTMIAGVYPAETVREYAVVEWLLPGACRGLLTGYTRIIGWGDVIIIRIMKSDAREDKASYGSVTVEPIFWDRAR